MAPVCGGTVRHTGSEGRLSSLVSPSDFFFHVNAHASSLFLLGVRFQHVCVGVPTHPSWLIDTWLLSTVFHRKHGNSEHPVFEPSLICTLKPLDRA